MLNVSQAYPVIVTKYIIPVYMTGFGRKDVKDDAFIDTHSYVDPVA
jgi:hypothetical protein